MPELKVLVDYQALWAALDRARRDRELSWRDVAKAVGTSPSTFTRIANGKGTDADTFASLAKWLGVAAERFMRSTLTTDVETSARTLAAISGHLRADPKLGPELAREMENIVGAAYKALTAEKKGRRRATRLQARS